MDLVGERASLNDLKTTLESYVTPEDSIDTEQEL